MELTLEVLEAKRQAHAEALRSHEAAANANYGAVQLLDELIAVARAQKPTANEKK